MRADFQRANKLSVYIAAGFFSVSVLVNWLIVMYA